MLESTESICLRVHTQSIYLRIYSSYVEEYTVHMLRVHVTVYMFESTQSIMVESTQSIYLRVYSLYV